MQVLARVFLINIVKCMVKRLGNKKEFLAYVWSTFLNSRKILKAIDLFYGNYG